MDKQQHNISSVGQSSYQNSRPPHHNAACMSLRLEPWTCSTSAAEQYPSFSTAGGGAWVPSPEIEGGEYRENAIVEGITHCEELCSPMARINPLMPKRLVLASRDKESLMEEIISLKKAILDQALNFTQHKVHASTVELENRKLERDVEDLEMQGSEAPRTGGLSRLRAKIQGLKVMLENLQSTCEAQREELSYLCKDMHVTRTREVEVERDVFAEEILRLQRLVKRLKTIQNSLSCENKELCRIKDKTVQLEISNQRLETYIAVVQKALNKANQELSTYKHRARESFIAARKDAVKCKELQEQATFLEGQLQKERAARCNTDRQVSTLEGELERLLFQLEDKEHCRTNMRSRGVEVQQIQNRCADRNCKQVARSNHTGNIRKARHPKGSQGPGEPIDEQMLSCHVNEVSQKKVVHGLLSSEVTVKRGVVIPKLKLELVRSIDLGNGTCADTPFAANAYDAEDSQDTNEPLELVQKPTLQIAPLSALQISNSQVEITENSKQLQFERRHSPPNMALSNTDNRTASGILEQNEGLSPPISGELRSLTPSSCTNEDIQEKEGLNGYSMHNSSLSSGSSMRLQADVKQHCAEDESDFVVIERPNVTESSSTQEPNAAMSVCEDY